ncbi:hypothetical protein ACJDU8_02275 [Clostridium sp. WILCCON 0269]|uniref:Core-binding (CB) domain-containing protein n=1 Tax=Candidatus Clostridium eludens TaxID=3381663 RepID=A0ABW8SGP7_9CLOT
MQLEDILNEFIFDCEIRNFSKRTLKSYRNNNALFHNFLKNEFKITKLEQIKAIHIKKYSKFIMATGARNNETCTLLKEDVKDRVILLLGKGNKQRQVAISPLLKKHMIRYEHTR